MLFLTLRTCSRMVTSLADCLLPCLRGPLMGTFSHATRKEGTMKFAILALAVAPAMSFAAGSRQVDVDRITDASHVINELANAPAGIPPSILEKAQCIGVIPSVKKAAFVFGAKYGKGVMVCRTANGWSGPSTVIITGGSFGLQLGAGETDLVFAVRNHSGEDKIMQDKFTFNASAGAMAGPVGRTGQAETDAELHAQILSWSRSRGLYAGLDLGGATLRPDNDANRRIYGRDVTERQILTGEVPRPADANTLYAALQHYPIQPKR